MKKGIFTLVMLAAMAVQSHAQEKGDFWVGGSFGIYIDNTERSGDELHNLSRKDNNYSIEPELGYVFSDRWAAGIRLGFDRSKNKTVTDYDLKNQTNTFQVAPFVRYTCLNWRKFSMFVDAGLLYSQYKVEDIPYVEYNISYVKQNRYGAFLQPGFSLRLSSCIALTGRLNFFDVAYEKDEQTRVENYLIDRQSFRANLNSPFNLDNFTIGFNFHF